MTNQERTVIGYPMQTSQATFPTTCTATTTNTNSMAIHTPTTTPFTSQNQQNTDIRSTPMTKKEKICCTLFICFLIAAVILFYFLLKPHLYTPDFRVDSVTVYPFNISSSSHITADWHFSFTVSNPNYEFPFYYDDIWASVFYKETNISSTTVGSFLQDKNDKRSVQVTIVASPVYVNNSVASAIIEDWSHEAVNFTVTVNAIAKIYPATNYEEQKQMTVSCEDVKVDFSLNTTFGTMLSGSRECMVSLYKLKK